jgi:hypothetical protein
MGENDRMLHLCSGDDGLRAWKAADLPGEALPWRDSPAMGPWSADPACRARLRAQYWGLPAESGAFREEASTLRALAQAESAVLWFTPEPWDQLAQLWVVAALSRDGAGPYLALAPLPEGGARMVPGAMARALALRVPLAPADRAAAAGLWERFEAQDWPALWKWLHQAGGLDTLPHLARALARVLEDRPPVVPGRTERQVRHLQAAGVQDLPDMMRALAALEEPYGLAWYGDLVVRKLMDAGQLRPGSGGR